MNVQPQSARLRPFRPVPFGRYTLLSPLSVGGMGEIFLARLEGAQGFEKLCVIKKILPSLARDPEFVERFVNEAKILVKLSHGSIAQVLDVGLHEGDPYIALEFIDGKDLRKIAARARDRSMPLPLTFVLYVMGRVLDALAYAHRKRDDDEREIGLVHRDVSPQNILISYEGEVKVIDFGLAKSTLNTAKTNPSIILGKFLYMSPEQARHQKVDRRADLYAAGLCLYELVCGRNPFDGVPPHELMTRVAHPSIPPIHTIDPLCPAPVQEMIARALEVDPAKRFQSAEEFRGRLQACLLEIDPAAGPESVSRYMREAFAAEYQQERRLLASLRAAARPVAVAPDPAEEKARADHETAVLHVEAVAPSKEAARALAEAPATPAPRPVMEGPIQPAPLSFAPTPRTREDGGESALHDGETVPGVVLTDELREVLRATAPDAAAEFLDSVTKERDTQPRVVLGDPGAPLVPEDTQPRVVVGTLLEDGPVLPPPQGRAQAPTRILPRVAVGETDPGHLPAASAEPLPPTVENPMPPAPGIADEDTGIRTVPARSPSSATTALRWFAVVCTLAVLGGGGWSAWTSFGEEMWRDWQQPRVAPAALEPLPIALGPGAGRGGAGAGGVLTPEATGNVNPAAQAGVTADVGEATAGADAGGGASADAGGAGSHSDLLELLEPVLEDTPARPAGRKAKRTLTPEMEALQSDWAELMRAFRVAKRRHTCESRQLQMICLRVNMMEPRVRELEDHPEDLAELRQEMEKVHQALRQLRRGR